MGWQIGKQEGFIIEAEAHAIWEDPYGTFHDISQKQDHQIFEHIVFIKDPRLNYQGKRIDNIRLNITDNLAIDDLLKLKSIIFDLQNKLEDTNYSLNIYEIRSLKIRNQQFNNLLNFISSGNTENDNCYCGSENVFKECHAKQINSFQDYSL